MMFKRKYFATGLIFMLLITLVFSSVVHAKTATPSKNNDLNTFKFTSTYVYDQFNNKVLQNLGTSVFAFEKESTNIQKNNETSNAKYEINILNEKKTITGKVDYTLETVESDSGKITVNMIRFVGADNDGIPLDMTIAYVNDNVDMINGSGVYGEGENQIFFAMSNYAAPTIEELSKSQPLSKTETDLKDSFKPTPTSISDIKQEMMSTQSENNLFYGHTTDLTIRISMNRSNIIRGESAYVAGAFAARRALSTPPGGTLVTTNFTTAAKFKIVNGNGTTIITTHPFSPNSGHNGGSVSIGFSYLGFGLGFSYNINTSSTSEGSTGSWSVNYPGLSNDINPFSRGAAFEGFLRSDKAGNGKLNAEGELTWCERHTTMTASYPYYYTRAFSMYTPETTMTVNVVNP